MRILVIGSVAGGASAAAKARRNTEEAEIVIYEKGRYTSYVGCGMPYYLGKVVEDPDELTPRDPSYFKSKYNVDILTRHEVLSIHPTQKTVCVKDLETNSEFEDHYDKLIIATGANATIPPIKGRELPHVFPLRTMQDMLSIDTFIKEVKPISVAIIGSGFIGLELSENFKRIGLNVTLLEKMDQVSPTLDSDMAVFVKQNLEINGVPVITDASIEEIKTDKVLLADGRLIDAEMVIIATGVRPNVELAKQAGVEIGKLGGIKVNRQMETNLTDIYACGDCIEQFNLITGKATYVPLGSTANKTGRIAGDAATGGKLEFSGILGTSIYRIFNLTVAQTGLNEKQAASEGFDFITGFNIKPNKPEYISGKDMIIKSIADKTTGKMLGAQIVGEEGVDKRIDVFATAITFGAKAEDLSHLDLAYAPPFATSKDPILYVGMSLDNALRRGRKLIGVNELDALISSEAIFNLIDSRKPKDFAEDHIPGAINIPLEDLRQNSSSLDKHLLTVVYCNRGQTSSVAQNLLINLGFDKVFNLTGGIKIYRSKHALENG